MSGILLKILIYSANVNGTTGEARHLSFFSDIVLERHGYKNMQ